MKKYSKIIVSLWFGYHRLIALSSREGSQLEANMYFQRIADLRQDHDLTQQEVADILNCKREVYRRYKKGILKFPFPIPLP